MFWELIFAVQDPWPGEPDVGLRALTPVGEPQFVGHSPRGMGLDYIVNSPLLPVSLWFFLYVFSCRRSFLVGSGLFISGCPENSCGFGVLVRGGELKVFLLHHLG